MIDDQGRTRVTSHGAVVLSPDVVCDGFLASAKVRVQSHVHDDHMSGFERSKIQTILCSYGTRELLIAEFNADLQYRANLIAAAVEEELAVEGVTIELHDAFHMLGSVQTVVTHADGYRTGYSGDFSWPLEHPMQVDELVVDSTYGSPNSVRGYSQEQAEHRFIEIALEKAKLGPLLVHGHRGTLQRAVALLDGATHLPMLASARQLKESNVYLRAGLVQAPLLDERSPEGREALRSGRYIRFLGKGDYRFEPKPGQYKILLSAYMAPKSDPVLVHSDISCRVAISNHADFAQTLEYIQATGASLVRTDNCRGGHGVELAREVETRLGIRALPADPDHDRRWGGD